MSWNSLPQKEEEIDGAIPEPPPAYKEPDTKTQVLDLASEVENKKTYTPKEGEEKPFETRKAEGFSMAPPVDIYEPGFRSDMYEAIIDYFKRKKDTRDKNNSIREKLGWK